MDQNDRLVKNSTESQSSKYFPDNIIDLWVNKPNVKFFNKSLRKVTFKYITIY